MAVSKSAGETRARKATPKAKAAAPKAAAKKAAPKKAASASTPAAKTTDKKAAPASKAVVKKAAPKKAAGPKLTPTQETLLETISRIAEPQGYVAEKKLDQKLVDALLKHKLVKKGKKDEKTKNYYVQLSLAGKKFLNTKTAPAPKV